METYVQTVFAENFFSAHAGVLSEYLDSVGIPETVLSDPTVLVTCAQFVELLEVAAQKSGDECLGLHMGERQHPEDLGVLGYAIENAATLVTLIQSFVRYFSAYGQGVETALEIDDRTATLSYRVADPGIIQRRQDAELTFSFVYLLIKQRFDAVWQAQEVHFEHEEPKDISEHERIFDARILFGQPKNALVFDKKFLSLEQHSADPRLFPVLEEHLEKVLLKRAEETELVAKVGRVIAASLSTQVPSLSELADELAMPSWTLQRRLRDKGYGYNDLVTDIRLKMAKAYLKESNMTLAEIGFLLGYAEASSFSRAFRRQTGITPLEYRGK